MEEHKKGNPFTETKNKVNANKRILPEEAKPKAKPEPEEKNNILAGMFEKKPEAKSFGYYLDVEVDEALGKLAKINNSTKSKVLNTLLRNMLMNE